MISCETGKIPMLILLLKAGILSYVLSKKFFCPTHFIIIIAQSFSKDSRIVAELSAKYEKNKATRNIRKYPTLPSLPPPWRT